MDDDSFRAYYQTENLNHILQEGGGEAPHGSLGWAIDQHFGSFEKLIAKMNTEGAGVQGSGWVVCYPLFFNYHSLLLQYNHPCLL